jgi:hypothetical protein
MRVGPSLLLMLGLFACRNDNEVIRQVGSDLFYQVPTDQVDILWVTDNSCSMADEQAAIGAKFESFIGSIVDSNIDFHIGVITTDLVAADQAGKLQAPADEPLYLDANVPDYAGRFRERISVGTQGSDREAGIDAAFQALSQPLVSGFNQGFRRPEATLSIIYLSDENDCTDRGGLSEFEDGKACYEHGDQLTPVKTLIDDYKDLAEGEARLLVSSIVGPEISEGCDGAKPGPRYSAMAEAFGGVQGNICAQDFSAIMTELGLQVSGTLTNFQLSQPAVKDSIAVWVDEVAVPEDPDNGWTYDEAYAILYFHGAGVPPRGSAILVEYEIAGPG